MHINPYAVKEVKKAAGLTGCRLLFLGRIGVALVEQTNNEQTFIEVLLNYR